MVVRMLREGGMKRSLLAFVAAAALLAAAPSAFCDTIQYELSGVAACPSGPSTCDTITGSFSFDTITHTVTVMDISDDGGTGLLPADTFTRPYGDVYNYAAAGNDAADAYEIYITFTNPLGAGAFDPVASVQLVELDPGVIYTASGSQVSGGASPLSATPLPAALPLFATGIGALGLLGWRRKRRAPPRSRLIKTLDRNSERPPRSRSCEK